MGRIELRHRHFSHRQAGCGYRAGIRQKRIYAVGYVLDQDERPGGMLQNDRQRNTGRNISSYDIYPCNTGIRRKDNP